MDSTTSRAIRESLAFFHHNICKSLPSFILVTNMRWGDNDNIRILRFNNFWVLNITCNNEVHVVMRPVHALVV